MVKIIGNKLRSSPVFRQGIRFFIDILFPPLCVHCAFYLADSTSPLCTTCESSIVRNTTLICPICKARLSLNKRVCNHSKKDQDRFPYYLGATTYYDDPIIKNIIHHCKYEGVHALADVCARILTAYVDQLTPRPPILDTHPIVIPIPLHPTKEQKRGFNQSALIAQAFAHNMNLAYAELLLKAIDNTPQAKTKSHIERFDRIRDAFVLPDPSSVQNKNIILIDDVSTSGATLSTASHALRRAGAKQILALVIAKA